MIIIITILLINSFLKTIMILVELGGVEDNTMLLPMSYNSWNGWDEFL